MRLLLPVVSSVLLGFASLIGAGASSQLDEIVFALFETTNSLSESNAQCDTNTTEDEDAILTELVRWIQDNGGTIDHRQEVRGETPSLQVFATENIPEGTVLLSIPWGMILSIENPEDSDLCETIDALYTELDELEQDGSWFAPYLRHLQRYTHPIKVPAGWSEAGKDMVEKVLGDNLLQDSDTIDWPLDWWEESCPDTADLDDEKAVQAALLAIAYRCPAYLLSEDEEEPEYSYAMMPFYDLYSHRNGAWCNTEIIHSVDESPFVVKASRDIAAGEPIHISRGFGTTDLFIDMGIVETYPQHHSFMFWDQKADGMNRELKVSFDLEDTKNGTELTWYEDLPPSSRAWEAMSIELERLKHELLFLDTTDLEGVSSYEHEALIQYSTSLVNALNAAMEARDAPWPMTSFTILEYEVAGVNLGTYRTLVVESDQDAVSEEEPYKLFEDFDIGHLVKGDENWDDLVEYRRGLERPSLSFYVDKVARKRWLPTQGIAQAKQYATMYASELTNTGDIQDEIRALVALLPDHIDYAAKPSHHSEGSGVWLVNHDTETNRTSFSSTARQLRLDDKDSFDKGAVASALVKNLHAKARQGESWTLRNVKPGVVVEERQVEVDNWDRAPVEINMFVIWGRVWVGQINFVEGEGRFTSGWAYRNGTRIDDDEEESRFNYIEWPRLVTIAETLGEKKDMFRVDIFVGVPAGSPSLRADASREERLDAIEYAVSECEVYPTTSFRGFEQLSQDAARLWVAGYKIGNYVTVPNTEVPEEFLETGSLRDNKG